MNRDYNYIIPRWKSRFLTHRDVIAWNWQCFFCCWWWQSLIPQWIGNNKKSILRASKSAVSSHTQRQQSKPQHGSRTWLGSWSHHILDFSTPRSWNTIYQEFVSNSSFPLCILSICFNNNSLWICLVFIWIYINLNSPCIARNPSVVLLHRCITSSSD